VLTHSSRCVSLNQCLDAGIFQLTFCQVRLRAAAVGLNDNELAVIHNAIICLCEP